MYVCMYVSVDLYEARRIALRETRRQLQNTATASSPYPIHIPVCQQCPHAYPYAGGPIKYDTASPQPRDCLPPPAGWPSQQRPVSLLIAKLPPTPNRGAEAPTTPDSSASSHTGCPEPKLPRRRSPYEPGDVLGRPPPLP